MSPQAQLLLPSNLTLANGLTRPARLTTIGVTCMGGGSPCTAVRGWTPGREGHEQLALALEVVLEEPTANPVLGLEAYAATLAELITQIRTRRLQHLNVAQKAVPLHHVPRLWLEYFRDNPPAQSCGSWLSNAKHSVRSDSSLCAAGDQSDVE